VYSERDFEGVDMNARLVAAVALVLTGVGLSDPLLACGEKFLMRTRGTRFQRAALARSSAAILVYANPASTLPKALANVPVDATLRKAGYRPSTVTSPSEFSTALGRGGWDLVIVDVAESGDVLKHAQGSAAPVVLPVVFNATKAELAAAKKQHPRILKAPTKNQSFLDAIDEALASKPAASSRAEDGPHR
jgi:hypothetical protein